jgi:hypothetical protein
MIAPDAIERLRDTMAGQTGGGMTCMDADDARAILGHITALTADRDAAIRDIEIYKRRIERLERLHRDIIEFQTIAAGAHKEQQP